MDCLYLEIEGQWCLVGSVDQGLVKRGLMDLLDRMTKKRTSRKKLVLQYFFSPIARLPGVFQQITPPSNFWIFCRPNYYCTDFPMSSVSQLECFSF